MTERLTPIEWIRLSEDPRNSSFLLWYEADRDFWMKVLELDQDLAEFVASNKKLPSDIIALLANHRDRRVRYCLAYKNATPPEVLKLLAMDADESISSLAIAHKKMPISFLELFASGENVQLASMAREQIERRREKETKDRQE